MTELEDELLLQKWQNIVNILAKMSKVPVALIMRVRLPYIEVFRSSETQNNPYSAGDKEHLVGSGLYCERVINTKAKLRVKNALKEEDWKGNPDVKLGLISYLGFPIKLPNGEIFGTLCILDRKENTFSDDTEKLMLQFIDLIESHLDLIYKNQQLDITAEHEKFYRDLVTHDINNILQGCYSSVELLKELLNTISLNKRIREIIDLLETQFIKANLLVSKSRAISLLKNKESKIESIEFCGLLDESIKEISNLYYLKDIEINISSKIEKIHVKANKLVKNVIDNILINAIKHNRQPKVIIDINCEIVESDNGNNFLAAFIDNGIGIADDRKKIIFAGGDPSSIEGKGLGIGLHLVGKIIELYNGEIWVEDKIKGNPSMGSKFIFSLPIA